MTASSSNGVTRKSRRTLLLNTRKIERGYALILEGMGFDWKKDPHMSQTPSRAMRAMVTEICSGLFEDPPVMTTFPLEGNSNMVISRKIPIKSLCAHHLLPFIGYATVAYIPRETILGLSKLSRAVEYMMRRPQVQEQLTENIADFLQAQLDGPIGIGVVIQSRHFCMELRGVKHESEVLTSTLRGEFEKAEVRSEFLHLAGVR